MRFRYLMRRVDCKTCGVTVEQVPWAEGKHHTTNAFRLFLSQWAKHLSWKESSANRDQVSAMLHRDVPGILLLACPTHAVGVPGRPTVDLPSGGESPVVSVERLGEVESVMLANRHHSPKMWPSQLSGQVQFRCFVQFARVRVEAGQTIRTSARPLRSLLGQS